MLPLAARLVARQATSDLFCYRHPRRVTITLADSIEHFSVTHLSGLQPHSAWAIKAAQSIHFHCLGGDQFVAAEKLILETVISEMFEENAYIAQLDGRSDCVVIDPGFEPQPILQYLEQRELQLAAILNTHGHADHIAGNAALKKAWPDAPLVIGEGDAAKLTDPMLNLSGTYGMGFVSPEADILLSGGDRYQSAGFDFEIRDAPGHSCGHILFLWDACDPTIVFGGDVLFRRSVGRTDFPDGSFEQLVHSIKTQLFVLADDTIVLPGHGPGTTVGDEKRHNPFVGEAANMTEG